LSIDKFLNKGELKMKKRNILAIMLFSILFLGSIYFYYLNDNKIEDNKTKTESLKIELQNLKAENETLTKINSQLIETNSSISEKVNNLKSVTN
jgi:Tfp pilus assembly protein PilO